MLLYVIADALRSYPTYERFAIGAHMMMLLLPPDRSRS
jgi:hypothetical protein